MYDFVPIIATPPYSLFSCFLLCLLYVLIVDPFHPLIFTLLVNESLYSMFPFNPTSDIPTESAFILRIHSISWSVLSPGIGSMGIQPTFIVANLMQSEFFG